MNPAIVAPDAFDIVSVGVDKGLTPDQVSNQAPGLCTPLSHRLGDVLCFGFFFLKWKLLNLTLALAQKTLTFLYRG